MVMFHSYGTFYCMWHTLKKHNKFPNITQNNKNKKPIMPTTIQIQHV